jgi:hypothetical protein
MDDCIEVQWGLYIGYMRETLNYNITIITLTIIPLIPPLKCNVNAMTLHLKSSQNTHTIKIKTDTFEVQ